MARPALELADVIRAHGYSFVEERRGRVSSAGMNVLTALSTCRTAVQGGHRRACTACGHEEFAYNSCRNRHCPKCMGSKRAQWLAAREKDLLPVEYFHVVFTLPAEIAEIAYLNKKVVYAILCRSSAETLKQIARDPKRLGAGVGILSVLHTWGQNLHHHPHVHCVVPGGGLATDGGGWRSCPRGFFLPVKVLSPVYRGKFLAALKQAFCRGELRFQGALSRLADPKEFAACIDRAYRKRWVVYAKRPFGGPVQVLKYLARYTHRVALSNRRLLRMDKDRVTIACKDYKRGGRWTRLVLRATELLRRFLQHVLPRGFQRIRYYGFLSGKNRTENLERCRKALAAQNPTPEIPPDQTEFPESSPFIPACPRCKSGQLVVVEVFRNLPIALCDSS